jgi:hypothetical protein
LLTSPEAGRDIIARVFLFGATLKHECGRECRIRLLRRSARGIGTLLGACSEGSSSNGMMDDIRVEANAN